MSEQANASQWQWQWNMETHTNELFIIKEHQQTLFILCSYSFIEWKIMKAICYLFLFFFFFGTHLLVWIKVVIPIHVITVLKFVFLFIDNILYIYTYASAQMDFVCVQAKPSVRCVYLTLLHCVTVIQWVGVKNQKLKYFLKGPCGLEALTITTKIMKFSLIFAQYFRSLTNDPDTPQIILCSSQTSLLWLWW